MKQLPEDERPRERLIKGGEEGLTDAELLGIIIRDGTPAYSAVDLARRLLTKYGDFRTLSTKTITELSKLHGIGPAKAAQIKAVMAIARRFSTVSLKPGSQFKRSQDIFAHFHEQLRDKKQETFLVVLLDSKNRIIKDARISTGGLSQSLVHPRDVFNPAIKESAAAVVFVHNHPSGDPSPSKEDIELTQRLKEASHVVGIKILDHVIIGNGCYTSFKDEGLL
ncbi:MAG: RadC family protein [Candidatus Brocadiales bacterium]